MKKILLIITCSSALCLTGCVTQQVNNFSRTNAPSWTTLELREDISYERAWDTSFEILMKHFDIEMALRQDGYLRTDWLYTWSGVYNPLYRVRITIKYSLDRTKLQFRAEAQTKQGHFWIEGVDKRLLSNIQTDLMGTVGRTTR